MSAVFFVLILVTAFRITILGLLVLVALFSSRKHRRRTATKILLSQGPWRSIL